MNLCSCPYLLSLEQELNSCRQSEHCRRCLCNVAIKGITAALISHPLNVNCPPWSTFQAEEGEVFKDDITS